MPWAKAVYDCLKNRIDRIMEGTMYMMLCDESKWPVTRPEFDNLMNLVDVLKLERQLYLAKTTLILDLFDLVLNFNPNAPEQEKIQYKQNLRDKIKLVKETISCLK